MTNTQALNEKKYILQDGSAVLSPLSSFPFHTVLRFSLRFPANTPCNAAVLRIHNDSDGSMKLYPLLLEDGVGTTDLHLSILCGDRTDGLFYYCYDVYYADGCVTYGGDAADIVVPIGEEHKRQLLVYRSDFRTPEWLRGGLLYHIFVDRYATSGKCQVKPGAIRNPKWNGETPQYPPYPGAPFPNNEFFGGDLYGIIDHLDDIASLGVTCLYLSPIFEAASNHKYDTADYEHVDSMFGGDAALDALIEAADKRGIRIILDGVFNHTGSDSRYFNQNGRYAELGAAQSVQSPYYPWYSFTEYPTEYSCWWGVKILPKVRCDEVTYREYILGESGIAAKWMRRGIAGWRLDVADELSDAFLDSFRLRIRSVDPQAMLYGEVWEDASCKIAYSARRRYLRGGQLDSVMNYPLRDAIIRYIRCGDSEALRHCVDTVYRHYPKASADTLMNFLGTHDTMRILTALAGEAAEGYTNAQLAGMKLDPQAYLLGVQRLKLAYSLLSSMPGIPCIFYGDEAGMEGYGDPFCRRPYPWGEENTELLSYYRMCGEIHRRNPVFREGYVRLCCCTDAFVAVLRYDGASSAVILLLNRTDKAIQTNVSLSLVGIDNSYAGQKPVIPPMCSRFFSLSLSLTAEEAMELSIHIKTV